MPDLAAQKPNHNQALECEDSKVKMGTFGMPDKLCHNTHGGTTEEHVSMRAAHYLLGSVLILGGCVSSQLSSNTIDISATIAPIYISQVLGNFSKFIDNPDTPPSQATLHNTNYKYIDTVYNLFR
jgi:hypothetical protein